MIKNGINLNAAFRNSKKSYGIENAYRTLKGFVKFDNYSNNVTAWDYDSLVKYGGESSLDISGVMVISALEANKAIKQMIKVKS